MILDFPNVSVLGISQEARFFDHGTNYSNIQNIILQGLVIDLANVQGITGTWSGAEGLINTIYNNQNFQDLYINGNDFGTGRIINMSFSPGLDFRTKSYTANLRIYNSGNMSSFTGTYYSGIRIQNFQYLERFEENYDFTRKRNLGYNYVHNAAIQFNSGIGQLTAIPEARLVAQTLFTGSNLGIQFYSGFTNVIGKRYYTEAYNLIDNSCNFTETYGFDDYDTVPGNQAGTYSATRTNIFELSENGTISVRENSKIEGLISPTYQAALQAISNEMTGAYFRCGSLFNLYSPTGSTLFINSPIIQGRTFDLFNGILTYTIVFNNNPDNFGPYFWDYTDSIDRRDGILRVIENGTILGKNENRVTAFANAFAAWSGAIKPNMYSRVGLFYNGSPNTGIDPNLSFFIDTVKESYSPFKSKVSYNYDFTNEQVIVGSNGIKKIYVEEKDTQPLYSWNKINIFNNDEIAQYDYQAFKGAKVVSMRAYGEKINVLTDYFTSIIPALNSYAPNIAGSTYAIKNVTYSYDPNENLFDISASWLIAAPVPPLNISL